jgi:hypothetical protein
MFAMSNGIPRAAAWGAPIPDVATRYASFITLPRIMMRR